MAERRARIRVDDFRLENLALDRARLAQQLFNRQREVLGGIPVLDEPTK